MKCPECKRGTLMKHGPNLGENYVCDKCGRNTTYDTRLLNFIKQLDRVKINNSPVDIELYIVGCDG